MRRRRRRRRRSTCRGRSACRAHGHKYGVLYNSDFVGGGRKTYLWS